MNKKKIFLLITMLISIITIFSFAALYFVLPQVYLYSKNYTINHNLTALVGNLSGNTDTQKCKDLIYDFVKRNNAVVVAYDKNGEINSELSSIATMIGSGTVQIKMVETRTPVSMTTITTTHPPGKSGQEITDISVPEKTGQAFYIGRDSETTLKQERNIENGLISRITISSAFQPISEAKIVLLILSPFMLFLDILLGLAVTYMYLRREAELAQNKTDFMRAAHHELKTPIAALSGIVDGMIDNVGVYKDRDEYLPKAKETIERLTFLTNDVLNATQSMDNKISKEKLDVGDLLEGVLREYKSLIADKALELRHDRFKFTYKTNRVLLKNVLSNLISNAVKYTYEKGYIDIKFADNSLYIENECDNIPEGKLDRLFEPFTTFSGSRSRDQSGNGLGLYIVKRNLELLRLKFQMYTGEKGMIFKISF